MGLQIVPLIGVPGVDKISRSQKAVPQPEDILVHAGIVSLFMQNKKLKQYHAPSKGLTLRTILSRFCFITQLFCHRLTYKAPSKSVLEMIDIVNYVLASAKGSSYKGVIY